VPKLVLFRGDAVETEVPLSGTTVRLGRHESNDVVLDDSQNGVSRFHAEVRREAGGYVIVDMKSRNGIWVNGRRIKDKAPLALGVPVTIGGFELALEDDPSGTFVNEPAAQRPSARQSGTGPSPAQRPKPPAAPALSQRNQQILMGSGAVLLVIAVCAVTYTVVRRGSSRPPVEVPVAQTTTSIAPLPTAVNPEPIADQNKLLNEQDLGTARELMAAKDYDGALSQLQAVLERDVENAEAAQMKRDIEAARAAPKPKPVVVEAPAVVAIAGIPNKPGETQADYDVRANRIKSMLEEGRKALEVPDYATALARFRAVDREQPRYLAVDTLITDTAARQQKAVVNAIESGQQNEKAGNIVAARRSYDAAVKYDPTSAAAQQARAALLSKMNADAGEIYEKGDYALTSKSYALAEKYFKDVIEKTMPGDELYEKAKKGLEELAKR
jgi:hypothetical protein